jgi:hypothetical protein
MSTGLRCAVALGGLVLVGVVDFACSSKPPPAAVVIDHDGDVGGGDAGAGFTFQSLGCGNAGTQSTVAIGGSKVAFASLAKTTMTTTCTVTPGAGMPPMMSQISVWNVCYAELQADGTYTSKVVSSQPYAADPTGVGLAFDSKGNQALVFTGEGSVMSATRCGANELFLTLSQGGTFGTPTQISHGSPSDGLIASQAGNCSEGICSKGDTTGLWPAIGFDPNDNAMIPFRDIHFGFGADDFANSDVELAEGSGGSFSILTIDVSRGGGDYNRIVFDSAGLPQILQYDDTGGMPGVYINRDVTPGGLAAQEADGGWPSTRISTNKIAEQLGFGLNAQGLYAAAYYDNGVTKLLYTESTDGSTWSDPVSVDTNGSTGFYPSLAFDSNGDPAIAYYRCNAQGPTNMQCDPADDGLYLARRKSGKWTPEVVHADPATTDGLYPALGFVNGKIVIAFQITSFDPISMASSASWMVAEGP